MAAINLVLKITAGIILAVVLLSVGCSVLISSDPDVKQSLSDLDDMTGANDAKYQSGMRWVVVGMSRSEVMTMMGTAPRDRQVIEDGLGKTEYLYWGSWQVTLVNGKVESKSRF